MDAYERCSTHGLRKCAVCDRPAKPGAEPIQTTVFPPEMLDGPGEQIPTSDPLSLANPKVQDVLFSEEPPFEVKHLSGPKVAIVRNPIVEAAAEYSEAQKRVELILNKILQLKAQIADAETMNAEAIADRDMKKQVLQKLVAE